MPKILNTLFYLLYFKLSMKIYLIKINAPKLIYWSILVAFFFPGWCDDINCYPFVYWVNGLRLLSCEVYLPGEWNLQYTLQKRERSFLVCWLYSVNKNWQISRRYKGLWKYKNYPNWKTTFPQASKEKKILKLYNNEMSQVLNFLCWREDSFWIFFHQTIWMLLIQWLIIIFFYI